MNYKLRKITDNKNYTENKQFMKYRKTKNNNLRNKDSGLKNSTQEFYSNKETSELICKNDN